MNIAASNNPYSSGVTPRHLAAIAEAAPVVQVFDVPRGALLGVTGEYELRADGCELWSHLDLESEPESERYHGEAVLMKELSSGALTLGMVALTALPRGAVQGWIANRYPGKVGRL